MAIIFPKYRGGVISGEEITAETLKEDSVRVDPAVLRGNAYAVLRQRGKPGAERAESGQNEPPYPT